MYRIVAKRLTAVVECGAQTRSDDISGEAGLQGASRRVEAALCLQACSVQTIEHVLWWRHATQGGTGRL
jgi:hypothetical protein